MLVTVAIITLFAHIARRHPDRPELMRPAMLIVALVAIQVTLGALTVLSRRDPLINSFHVVCGALVLTTSLVITLRSVARSDCGVADCRLRIYRRRIQSAIESAIQSAIRIPQSAMTRARA